MDKRNFFLIFWVLLPFLTLGQVYRVEDQQILSYNLQRYNNRPLYINNSNAFILTGDVPLIRFIQGEFIYGHFMLGLKRQGVIRWIQDFSGRNVRYNNGTMEWFLNDYRLDSVYLTLKVLPMDSTTGLAARLTAGSFKPGDTLIWAYGSAEHRKWENLSWKMDVMGYPKLIEWGFDPQKQNSNQIIFTDFGFQLSLFHPDSLPQGAVNPLIVGDCSYRGNIRLSNASLWDQGTDFLNSDPNQNPLVVGMVPLDQQSEIFWCFERINTYIEPENQVPCTRERFLAGEKRIEAFNQRIRIVTPDPFLDALAKAAVHAHDGAWYPPVFVHGPMQWNYPYPGWRALFGAIMLGWHDRVSQEAKHYLGYQVKQSHQTEPKNDPVTLYTAQHPESRYYGVGRIDKDQGFYNMQTQFFDQLIQAWRWTADPELEHLLREGLELHLRWARECFDPDNDGVYESYINVWPTDSQWYNGGGTAEETAYAYVGHRAARDMARRAHDTESADRHQQMMDKIRNGFFKWLWVQERGHSGSYREQGGHHRLHTDPWLYSIFLPVDAQLVSPEQAIESIYYSEWALQNDPQPFGGRQVWTSNWVPGIWSVRELSPGDNYHLALAYFQAGLPDDGWALLKGTFMESGFNGLVPGNLGMPSGGVDFSDCKDMFMRTLVQGLFGYNPDYPNGQVLIKPQLPTDWDSARIALPDFSLDIKRTSNFTRVSLELARKSGIQIEIPITSSNLLWVKNNGAVIPYQLQPGPGYNLVTVNLPEDSAAHIEIGHSDICYSLKPQYITVNAGDSLAINFEGGLLSELYDPQNVFQNFNLYGNHCQGVVGKKHGFHTLILKGHIGRMPVWKVYRVKINDEFLEKQQLDRVFSRVPDKAKWQPVDMSQIFNADVRKVYQQSYLSPRPNTVSVRLGSDGYSPWTFYHWHSKPPKIEFDYLSGLQKGDRILTKQGVPFRFCQEPYNIAFTSLWDNYPDSIDVVVNKEGQAVWFLVAGSTNVMQNQIANAVIHLHYADGIQDSLELIPPVNFWNLSSISTHNGAPLQDQRTYYDSEIDKFCLPDKLPEIVALGSECNAMLLNLKLRPGVALERIRLECLSQEVVIGIMGITIMK